MGLSLNRLLTRNWSKLNIGTPDKLTEEKNLFPS